MVDIQSLRAGGVQSQHYPFFSPSGIMLSVSPCQSRGNYMGQTRAMATFSFSRLMTWISKNRTVAVWHARHRGAPFPFSHVFSEEHHQCSIFKNITPYTNCLINGRQWRMFRWRSNSLYCAWQKSLLFPNNAPAFKSPDILFCSTLMQQLPTICRSAAVLRSLASFLLLLCSLFCPSCHLSAAVFLWHSSLY